MADSFTQRESSPQNQERLTETDDVRTEGAALTGGYSFAPPDGTELKGGRPNSGRLTPAKVLALQRTIGNQKVLRLLAQRSSTPAASPTGGETPQGEPPQTEVQRTPEGWDKADEETMKPAFYEGKGHSYGLINEALNELNLDDDKERKIANQWGKFAIDHGYVGKGPVKSTYKSTYDYAPNDFSVSQNVPLLDTFVVHAHIKSDDTVALDGGVNLKYSKNEGGMKAANVPGDTAKDVIDVGAAKSVWFSDTNKKTREETEERYKYWKLDELFNENGNPPALAPVPAPVAPPKFEPDYTILRQGAKYAKTPANFWKMINDAIEEARKGDGRAYDTYIQAIKDKIAEGPPPAQP